MKRIKLHKLSLLILLIPFIVISVYCNSNNNLGPKGGSNIELPAGFKISVYADNVPGARSMALSKSGILFVGTRGSKVYAVIDSNKDFKADRVITIASGSGQP